MARRTNMSRRLAGMTKNIKLPPQPVLMSDNSVETTRALILSPEFYRGFTYSALENAYAIFGIVEANQTSDLRLNQHILRKLPDKMRSGR